MLLTCQAGHAGLGWMHAQTYLAIPRARMPGISVLTWLRQQHRHGCCGGVPGPMAAAQSAQGVRTAGGLGLCAGLRWWPDAFYWQQGYECR